MSHSKETEAMAVVNQFVDGFNNGDIKMLTSACADEVSIIDEFSTYEWHGAGACAKWSSDYDADAKKMGITEGHVTLASRLKSMSLGTAPTWSAPPTTPTKKR